MVLLLWLASRLSCRWVVMVFFCKEGFWGAIVWWELASRTLTSCRQKKPMTSRLTTWFVCLMTSGSMQCQSAIRLCSCKRLFFLAAWMFLLEAVECCPIRSAGLSLRLSWFVCLSFSVAAILLGRMSPELCRSLIWRLWLHLRLIGRTFVWWQTIISLELMLCRRTWSLTLSGNNGRRS